MRDCGESDAREGQEPSDVIGSTQGGQPSDVPGGHPASFAFTKEDHQNALSKFFLLPDDLVGSGKSTLAQEHVIQRWWTPRNDEGNFLDYEFDAQPYGRFPVDNINSEVKPDGREDRQSD